MAISVNASTAYQSGSGGYAATHTFSDIAANVTDPYVVAFGAPRASTWITSFTIEGSAATAISDNISGDSTAGVDIRGRIDNSAASTVVIGTSSYKLMAGVAASFSGVDQTTPFVGTPVKANDYTTTATAAYTGTAGNLLVACISTQEDRTFTASNCTEVAQASHADANLGSVFMGVVEATGSAQTIGATYTGAHNWRLVIFELKAAAGGAVTVVKDIISMGVIPFAR